MLSRVQFFAMPWTVVHQALNGILQGWILQARIPEWAVIPFSRGSSQPSEWTQVSRTAGGFFASWSTREAPKSKRKSFSSSQKLRELTANRPSLKEALKDEFQAERRQSQVDSLTKRTMETSLVVQWLRICLPMQKTQVRSLNQEDPLEKGMATPCSILAWRIPWTEEPGRL